MKEHPITPSDELIEQWLYDGQVERSVTKHIATQAAELEGAGAGNDC